MKNVFIHISQLLLIVVFAFANNLYANNIRLRGVVVDSVNSPLQGATVMLLRGDDAKLDSYCVTNRVGEFNLRTTSKGELKLQITYIGYGSFVKPIQILETDTEINLNRIVLQSVTHNLEGVLVSKVIPIRMNRDTVEYSSAAFKTPPNANVEELLKKLPGIEVDKDGSIKAYGEDVKNIFVEGKQFFEGDPKIATRNLSADIVNKVQVFDKKSDFTEFTGVEDGEMSKAINLKLKDGKNRGLFGNVKVEGAAELQYNAGFNLNRFTDKIQLSSIGNTNNLNQQAFTIEDYLKFSGALDDAMSGELQSLRIPKNLFQNKGLTQSSIFGTNFNYDVSTKTTIRSNYYFTYSDNVTDEVVNSNSHIDDFSFSTESNAKTRSELMTQNAKIKIKHRINKNQELVYLSTFNFTDNENKHSINSNLFESNDFLKRNSIGSTETDFKTIRWNNSLKYRFRFTKPGRYFSTGVKANLLNDANNSEVENVSTYYHQDQTSNNNVLSQLQSSDLDNYSFNLSADYIEPLGDGYYLKFQ